MVLFGLHCFENYYSGWPACRHRRRRVGEMGIKASTDQFGLNWNWGWAELGNILDLFYLYDIENCLKCE